MNKVILLGHLGDKPTIRNTSTGSQIANFSLATSESWKDKNSGERKSKTEWHKVVILNQALTHIAGTYLQKGSKVLIEGKIQTRKYTDKQGVDKWITEVVLDFEGVLKMLDSKEAPTHPQEKVEQESIVDDAIPF